MTAVAFAVLLLLAPQNPPPGVPPVGGEVDRSFEIVLPSAVEGPVLTVLCREASIRIPRRLLEEIAAADGDSWETEDQRRAQIAAGRAKRLLGATGAAAAGAEPSVDAAALGDAEHLVAQILAAGRAGVIPKGDQQPAARIVVRYWGTHPGPRVGFGRVVFLLPARLVDFFSISWFTA